MTSSVEQNAQTAEPALPENPPHARKLLESANSSSEQVGVLHLGFIATCSYVIVIAIGRTDLDLLIGKGIRLPIIDTEVPIVGFFAFEPLILAVVHFNLLLHLQLLARKLHAFDLADAKGELRDQLRIFPITCYLVGKTDELTRKLLSLMVSITVILLPLLTMLILQLQFLAYQSEVITWFQRFAVWLDLFLIVYFWPIIAESGGISSSIANRWRTFREQCLPKKRDWIAAVLFGVGLLFVFCGSKWYFFAGLLILFFIAINTVRYELRFNSRIGKIVTLIVWSLAIVVLVKTIHDIPHISNLLRNISLIAAIMAFTGIANVILLSLRQRFDQSVNIMLVVTSLCIPLSLGIQIDGKRIESFLIIWPSSGEQNTFFSSLFISHKRMLDLRGQKLFVNHPDPEILNQLRSSDWPKALQKIEHLNLNGRSLRHANLSNSLLCRADLRYADLQQADLFGVQMQGAHLYHAKLQNALLFMAQLQCTELRGAQMQGISRMVLSCNARPCLMLNFREPICPVLSFKELI